MLTLGKIERVMDLREVWKHEAKDFSTWLAEEENLQLLSDSIGIDIVSEELESSVGNFSVDILAIDQSTGRKVIIENQLEDTNHDHLGKIITYASGKDAKVIIWIVKRARDEHRQAIEWLNQHTDEELGFFLLEIELWKIGNSEPAPKFNVVVRPNDWAKIEKKKEGLSETKKLQLEFWQAFDNYAFAKDEVNVLFNQNTPRPYYSYNLRVKNSYLIELVVNFNKKRIYTALYVNNKNLYEHLKSQSDNIKLEFNCNLDWSTTSKYYFLITYHYVDIKQNPDKWTESFDWYIETALKLNDIVKKYSI